MRALFSLIMKRLLAFAFALLLAQTAQAADISMIADETDDHPAVLLIKGPIGDKSDIASFKAVAGHHKPAIVFLDSQGGLTMTAIEIGLIIHGRGFSTIVADSATCVSACGLIWIAGEDRFVGAKIDIGFHAARVSETSQEIASGANAIIGAYLYKIGVTDFRTIGFLTNAPPQHMTWINQRNAHIYKLDVKTFNLSEPDWAWMREALAVKTTMGTTGNIIHFVPTIGQKGLPTVLPIKENIILRAPPSEDHCVPSGTRACHCRLIDHVMICNAIPLSVTETIVPPVQQPAARPSPEVQRNDLITRALRRINDGDVATAREILAAAEDGTQGLVAFALAETYDPHMLAAWGTRGVVADIVRARALYRKALNLGVASAHSRLEALK